MVGNGLAKGQRAMTVRNPKHSETTSVDTTEQTGKRTDRSSDRAAEGSSDAADDFEPTTIEAPGDEMMQLLYRELRKLAAVKIKHLAPINQTLQATDLVHEVYLRMVKDPNKHWKGRRYFYRAAALAMRHILVERARSKMTEKRGGKWIRTDLSVSLADAADAVHLSHEQVLALDRALSKLQDDYPDLVEMVFMRYFCGLTVAEIAEFQGMSTRTVERKWKFARAWLISELDG